MAQEESREYQRGGDLSKPLWAIAVALWVLVIVGVIGAVKIYQVQQGLQNEIEKIRRWPRL